jgi:hypothetical protein
MLYWRHSEDHVPVASELTEYAESLRNEVTLDASIEGAEAMLSEVFTSRLIDVLVDAGEFEEAVPCYMRERGIEVHGYGIDDDDTLNLVSTIYRGAVPPASVTRTDVATAFRRLEAFWERARNGGVHDGLEESSDARDMALRVHRAARGIGRVKLFVVTDGIATVEYLEPEDVDGVEIRRSVWDITRLHRLESSGQRQEPIEVDLVANFGGALPCLSVGTGHEDYSAFLAVVPGGVLADIYDAYGPRLLELNVRSFLQARGKINRGIRDTLAEEPARFLAYNNGIAATASRVDVVDMPGGGTGISRIVDLQIVNGGQTTASIHRAMRTKVDLSDVSVQAKITVIDPARVEDIVPLISRYANSQNKVTEADLTANDPFHVELEKLSRSTWAPATDSTRRATRWFYERARGQYADALGRETTPARRRRFKEEWPSSQKFTKTDIAKFEAVWDQFPHLASLGAQKNFIHFMARMKERGGLTPDTIYFKRLIAKAVLFKKTDRIVARQEFGGYKANIVYYTIAKLSHVTAQRLNLAEVWDEQDLAPAVEAALEELSYMAYRMIAELTPGGANVTEWAKREQCWRLMRDQRWDLPSSLRPHLVGRVVGDEDQDGSAPPDADTGAEAAVIAEVVRVGPDGWLGLANWAKETGNLAPWQRKLAFGIGVRLKRGSDPTIKQAIQGKKILDAAAAVGYVPS